MENFEERLDDLINEALEAGSSIDDIISAFELKLMALKEEVADPQNGDA